MIPRSFSGRLAAAFLLILVANLGLADLLLSRAFHDRALLDLEEGLFAQARAAVVGLSRAPLQGPAADAAADAIGAACGCRASLIEADGRVSGDSSVDLESLASVEDHSDRPEVREALAGRAGRSIRRSDTLGADLLYAALPLGTRGGVLRLALPLDHVRDRGRQARRIILWVTLVVALMAGAAAVVLSRSISQPVIQLSEAGRRLAEGDYSLEIPERGPAELSGLARSLNRLARRVEANVAELSRDKAELEAILSTMVEAVLAVDPSGRVVAANPAFLGLFGLEASGLAPGRPLRDLVRDARLEALVAAVLKDRSARMEEIAVATPAETVLEAHAAPLAGPEGFQGALLVLHDVTRLRRLEDHRREFVANVSHELRTPLASIKGFAETLRGGVERPEDREDFLAAIERNADQMARLVDDLLDLSAIESGRRPPAPEPLDLLALAEEEASALRPLAEPRGVSVKVERSGPAVAVRADRVQMRQVLRNLLDNAVKYNREGGEVRVTLEASPSGAVLSVADEGPGIPAADLPRIFERFYRVDKARSRELGGTGLGLAIVKHIAESHGGSVSVESREGRGSVFSLRLPFPA